MKKLFSIVLTIALLLSAAAFPTAVSAADGATVTLALEADKQALYPGDTVNVTLKASTNTPAELFGLIFLTYDSAKLTLTEKPDTVNETTVGTLSYVAAENAPVSLNETAATLATLTFSVNASASGSASVTIDTSGNTGLATGTTNYTLSVSAQYSATISANAVVPQIAIGEASAADLVNNNTYYTNGAAAVLSFAVTGNMGTAKVYAADDAEFTTPLFTYGEGATTYKPEAGSYVVKVTPLGGTETTYAFTINADSIDASLTAGTVSDAVNPGAAVSVPVTIGGLGDTAQASMVSFTVEYDPAVLTLTVPETQTAPLTYTEGTASAEGKKLYNVFYNKDASDSDYAIGTGDTVVELSFTVASAPTYGTTAISFGDAQCALVTTVVSADTTEIAFTPGIVNVTVKPADGNLADATGAPDGSAWLTAAYNLTVSAAAGRTFTDLSMVSVEATAAESTNDLAALYAKGTAIANGTVTIDNETAYYYVVARIGSADPHVYELVTSLEPKSGAGRTNLDLTAPTISGNWTAPGWSKNVGGAGVTITLTGLTFADAASGIAKVQYAIDDATTYEDATLTDEVYTITFPADTSATNVTLKAVDNAGQESAVKEITVNVDGDAPTVTAAAGNVTASGRNIAITGVGDTTSGIATIKVYNAGNATYDTVDALETDIASETSSVTYASGTTDYTYEATASGNWYVVVADTAGNKTMPAAVNIITEKVTVGTISVGVLKPASGEPVLTSGGFKTNDALLAGDGGITTNGTFTYVAIKADTDADNCETTLTLAKDGATGEAQTGTIILDGAAEDVAGDYVLTVTTVRGGNASDSATATYSFTVVANQADMLSVDNNAYFSAYDYAVIRSIVDGKTDAQLPIDNSKFTGGLLSADVNGDFGYTVDDASRIVTSWRAVEYLGKYTFAKLNGMITENATLTNPRGE